MKSTDTISELEKNLLKLENLHASFDYLKISVASSKRIKNWSARILPSGEVIGEVLKPETINFRTHQPEMYGLFCERIFGPIKNWKCKCGKYNGFAIDKICDECQVEIIEARVRRYRMGYIDLTCPITHLWYLKSIPNYLCLLLRCHNSKLSFKDLDQIIYFKEGSKIVGEDAPLFQFLEKKNELEKFFNKDLSSNVKIDYLNEKMRNSKSKYLLKRRGSEIIKAALENINIDDEIKKNRSDLYSKNLISKKEILKRIRLLESFLATKTNPGWLVLTTLPVLPPNLRPLLELESGRLIAADVNEIYRLIITRNQRLYDFISYFIAPDLITIHGRKLLQEAVDSLIDNSRVPKQKAVSVNNKILKSLTENLEGKQGRFRQSLLGKRVDYSGRSVIVVGPTLRLNECGLPYEMATELFQPFLINELLKTKIKYPSHNIKLAHIIIKKNKPFIWRLVKKLTQNYSILLNRAPTLHRFGIQAFDPVIILGQAIHLHPLVCTGFNADFDGDQMAVHLPLYKSSQLEIRTMMRPASNILSPSNGDVILKPTQDMVIGCYYLTMMIFKANYFLKKCVSSESEALNLFSQKKIGIHSPILLRYSGEDFLFHLEKNELIFSKELPIFTLETTPIVLLKKYIGNKNLKTSFFLTNMGIFLVENIIENKYKLVSFFFETTAGRIIFNQHCKNYKKN